MTDASLASPSTLPIVAGQLMRRTLQLLGGEGSGRRWQWAWCALERTCSWARRAITLIHSDLKDNVESVQRFMNEARAAAAQGRAHRTACSNVGLLSTGEPYLVMEQLEGTGLDHICSNTGAGANRSVDIVLQACEG